MWALDKFKKFAKITAGINIKTKCHELKKRHTLIIIQEQLGDEIRVDRYTYSEYVLFLERKTRA